MHFLYFYVVVFAFGASENNVSVFGNHAVILELFLFQLLVVGGSFGLREFSQIRYDAQRNGRKVCGSATHRSQLTSV